MYECKCTCVADVGNHPPYVLRPVSPSDLELTDTGLYSQLAPGIPSPPSEADIKGGLLACLALIGVRGTEPQSLSMVNS